MVPNFESDGPSWGGAPVSKLCRIRVVRKTRLSVPLKEGRNGKGAFVGKLGDLLIFVEDHSIDEHVVAFAHIMHVDRHTDFDSRSDSVFIEDPWPLYHIRDLWPEAIRSRATAFPQDNCVPRCKRGDRATAFSRGSLRDLCPRERSRDGQGYAQ